MKTFINIIKYLLEMFDIDIEQAMTRLMKDEKSGTKILALLSIMQKENENGDLDVKMVA